APVEAFDSPPPPSSASDDNISQVIAAPELAESRAYDATDSPNAARNVARPRAAIRAHVPPSPSARQVIRAPQELAPGQVLEARVTPAQLLRIAEQLAQDRFSFQQIASDGTLVNALGGVSQGFTRQDNDNASRGNVRRIQPRVNESTTVQLLVHGNPAEVVASLESLGDVSWTVSPSDEWLQRSTPEAKQAHRLVTGNDAPARSAELRDFFVQGQLRGGAEEMDLSVAPEESNADVADGVAEQVQTDSLTLRKQQSTTASILVIMEIDNGPVEAGPALASPAD
ncbi:MAG: hypothetical protein KDA92_26805, partial [Planctomycetales bacterium]|nr:hypothetical protein [Planctomycetales bacterium]